MWLFAFHDFGKRAGADVSIVTALEKLLELEHVCFDNAVLFSVLDAVGFWLSEEHLFAQLSVVG